MSEKHTQGAFDIKWRCTKRETERAQERERQRERDRDRETERQRERRSLVSPLSRHIFRIPLSRLFYLFDTILYININLT